MLREELEKRLKDMDDEIIRGTSILNTIIARKEELAHILSEMDKFQEKCSAPESNDSTDGDIN